MLGVPLERTHNTEQEKHLVKINGHLSGGVNVMDVALRVSRIGNDVTTIGSGASVIPVQSTFYPQYVSTSVANADIVSNDQSFRVDSNVTTIDRKSTRLNSSH